jgi:tRNA/tmRNA/rRNA uracil-C5-methylase (TrmA/RlmC/RlmD family)
MSGDEVEPGTELEVEVGPIAHGGHWVARHDGRVIFVRHALEGERVRVVVTGVGRGGRYLQADAVEVLSASPDRVPAPCPYAGPGRCGGCDLQHVGLVQQRVLKAAVVREQLERLAGLDVDVAVEPVPGDVDGLRWRTRVEFSVGGDGALGLRRHRSHDVLPVDDCLIATDAVVSSGVLGHRDDQRWAGHESVDVIAPGEGLSPVVVTVPDDVARAPVVRETVVWNGERFHYALGARGFWQVHVGAAQALVDAVLGALRPARGDRVLDLYAGVGLFSVPLARAVGPEGRVTAVEADREAASHAETNLGLPGRHPESAAAEVRAERVDRCVRRLSRTGALVDLAVLAPPRAGARRGVVRDLAALRPRRIVYVACDPAALARDTAYLAEVGFDLVALRAFDAFPMTHHVECVATFETT